MVLLKEAEADDYRLVDIEREKDAAERSVAEDKAVAARQEAKKQRQELEALQANQAAMDARAEAAAPLVCTRHCKRRGRGPDERRGGGHWAERRVTELRGGFHGDASVPVGALISDVLGARPVIRRAVPRASRPF